MSLIRSVNNDLKCGLFAPAGGGQFAPAKVVKINRQGVVSLLWRGLLFLSGLSSLPLTSNQAYILLHQVFQFPYFCRFKYEMVFFSIICFLLTENSTFVCITETNNQIE
jgi:hypothetical protein